MDEDNDGRFPDDSRVEVRYPRTRQEELGDRAEWPWLPGLILSQCGPDEWYVCVEARELAMLDDGRPTPDGTADQDVVHPGVQELDDRGQLVWDHVGDEHQPDGAAAQIAFRPVPEVLRISILAGDLRQHGCWVPADISAGSLEQLRQRAVSPVPGAVRGIVGHLPNNFTADPGIGTPLHLNERRDRVLIDEQMVQAPAPGAILVGDRCLPADQKEAARITAVHLISRQQLRMVLQQLLQNRLSLIRCNRQGHEILALADEDDIIRHDPGPPKSRARSPALSRFASLRTSTSAQPWLPGFQRGVAVGSRPELGWPA
jgi:hypothetical protein